MITFMAGQSEWKKSSGIVKETRYGVLSNPIEDDEFRHIGSLGGSMDKNWSWSGIENNFMAIFSGTGSTLFSSDWNG